METLNVKIDSHVKRELKEFASEVGVPVSSLINGSIRQMLRTRTVTFSSAVEPNPKFAATLRAVEADAAVGRNVSKSYTSVDDMFVDLESEA
ncbi:MAG TPA: type II toxin-antitoxin system antitoxin, RelB/DinJ family [Candidatus Saccharimonadia bacterium]